MSRPYYKGKQVGNMASERIKLVAEKMAVSALNHWFENLVTMHKFGMNNLTEGK